VTNGSSFQILLDDLTKAKRLEEVNLSFRVPGTFVDQVLAQGADLQLECGFDAGRRAVKFKVDGILLRPMGLQDLVPANKAKTGKDGTATVSWTLPITGSVGGTLELQLTVDPSGGKKLLRYAGFCNVSAATQ